MPHAQLPSARAIVYALAAIVVVVVDLTPTRAFWTITLDFGPALHFVAWLGSARTVVVWAVALVAEPMVQRSRAYRTMRLQLT